MFVIKFANRIIVWWHHIKHRSDVNSQFGRDLLSSPISIYYAYKYMHTTQLIQLNVYACIWTKCQICCICILLRINTLIDHYDIRYLSLFWYFCLTKNLSFHFFIFVNVWQIVCIFDWLLLIIFFFRINRLFLSFDWLVNGLKLKILKCRW